MKRDDAVSDEHLWLTSRKALVKLSPKISPSTLYACRFVADLCPTRSDGLGVRRCTHTSSGMALPSSIRCKMDMHCVLVSNDPELAKTMMGGTAPETIMACTSNVSNDAARNQVERRDRSPLIYSSCGKHLTHPDAWTTTQMWTRFGSTQ